MEAALRPCGPAGVADAAASHTQVDLLLTDLSPNRTGMHDVDEARQTDMIEQALLLARRHLRDGGTFLTKVHELNRTEKVFNRAHTLVGLSGQRPWDAATRSVPA